MIEVNGIKYLTMIEAAKIVKLNPRTLRMKCSLGEVQGTTIGKKRHTNEEWLNNWIVGRSNFQEGTDPE